MATLKVGMRVRIVGVDRHDSNAVRTLGHTGTITHAFRHGYQWAVEVDDVPAPGEYAFWAYHTHQLAPLTDPRAEEFIAKLKKLGNEPVPLTPKQMEEVRG